MGTYIKIRYRGRLKSPSDVKQLITETEDICASNSWTFKIWDEDWNEPQTVHLNPSGQGMSFEGHAPLKGISFSVGASENIWLTFTPDGMLQSLFTLVHPTFFLDDEKFPWQRVKTGYDGAKSHIEMCKLFRYLEGRYFEIFEVMDESGYWEERDDAKFTKWMNDYIHDSQLLEEETNAILADESLTIDQKRERSFRLIKEHGEKYQKKNME